MTKADLLAILTHLNDCAQGHTSLLWDGDGNVFIICYFAGTNVHSVTAKYLF